MACEGCGLDFAASELVLRDYGTDPETGYRDTSLLCEQCAVKGILVYE